MKKLFTSYLTVLLALVYVNTNAQDNLISGGNMESADEAGWSVTTLETDPANSSSYAFGYTADGPSGGQDGALHYTITNTGSNGAHLMFYQQVTLEKGKRYIFDMAAKAIQEMNNSWFEVYLGGAEPQDGADYGGGMTPLGGWKFSGWEGACAGLDLFNGTLREDGCLAGSSDTIYYEGTGDTVMYIGFKAGIWATETTVEFVVDNVTLSEAGPVSNKIEEVSVTSIYPNPASSVLNVVSESKIANVRIYNVMGQKVMEQNQVANQVNIAELESGLYFIELSNGTHSEILKFQKK